MTIGTLIRGDDNVVKVEVSDNGTPIDITGDQLTLTIKQNMTDVDAAATFQRIDIIADSADSRAGVHRIQLPNTLAVGAYFYDVQIKRIVSGNGGISTLEIGKITVAQDVTLTP